MTQSDACVFPHGRISSLQKYKEENKQNEEKTPVFWKK